MTFIHFN